MRGSGAGQPPTVVDEAGGSTRRRRGRIGAAEFATPLAATFLGLLLVQSFRPAEAAEAVDGQGAAGASGDGTMPFGLAEGTTATSFAPLPAAGTATALAAGSVLSVGSLIDPAALTQLSGEARFAEPLAIATGGGEVGVAAISGDDAAAPAAVAGLGLAGAALDTGLPDYETTASGGIVDPDADLADLGEYVRGGDEDQTVELTNKDDVFLGGDGDETVSGLDGDDELSGGGGDDVLDGGGGDDVLDGGSGDDDLLGRSGSDTLTGGSGDDILAGGTGSDRLTGETGDDVLVLDDPMDAVKELSVGIDGGGSDTIRVADGYAAALAKALPGLSPDGSATFVMGEVDAATFPSGLAPYRQQIDPDIENLRLDGSAGHDVVGGAGGNVIEGNLGANRLHGGGGDDFLYGDAGDDWLDGGSGDDWLDGGLGSDTLYGGSGNDVFVLGLHETTDHVWDDQGLNSLRLSTADPEAVGVALRDGDLHVTVDGRTLATIHDYAANADHFAGIDLGEGIRSFDSFLAADDASAATASTATTAADWLDGLIGGEAPTAADAAPTAGTAEAAFASIEATDFTVPDLTGGADFWLPADSASVAPFAPSVVDSTNSAGLSEDDRPSTG